MSEELLRLENLSIDYKVKDGYLSAVNDVNCVINKGEVFAIVGESGCGKSTVAHSIMNLLPGGNEEISGKIIFKGKDLRECTRQEMEAIRGKEIGMIFQNPLDSLNPVYKVGDQMAEAILLDKVDKQEAWNRVIKLFKDVKMPDAEERVNSFPHELSGGMRQRVGIAMAMIFSPKILLADEPTSALDVTTQAQIIRQIVDIRNEYKVAVIIVTHNIGVASYVSNKIMVMQGGKVVEYGKREDVIGNPQHEYTKQLLRAVPIIGGKCYYA